MNEVFICDGIRTPFGKHGGSLSSVRTDDLGALPIKYLVKKITLLIGMTSMM